MTSLKIKNCSELYQASINHWFESLILTIGSLSLPSRGDSISGLVGLRGVALRGEGSGDAEARHGQGPDHETGRGQAGTNGGDH